MAVPPPDGFYTIEEFLADSAKFAAFAGAIHPKKTAGVKGVLIEGGKLTVVPHTRKSAPPPPRQQLQQHLVETGEAPPPKKPKPKRKLKSHKQRRVLPPIQSMGDDIPLLNLGTLWGLSNPELRIYCAHFGVKLYTGARKEGMIRKIKDAGQYLKLERNARRPKKPEPKAEAEAEE